VLDAIHLHAVMRRVGSRHWLAAITQPVTHELYLVPLSDHLPLAQCAHVGTRTV